MPKKKKSRSLTTREYLIAVKNVAALSFRIAPGAVIFKMAGALITALLPIVTTYYAALTTTALVEAYGGNAGAGDQAIRYVVITSVLGLFTIGWSSIDQYIQQLMRFRVEAKISDVMYEHFHQLEFWRYDDKQTVDLYDKAQRFTQFYAYVFDRIAGLLSSLIGMVTAVVALVFVVPFIALIVLVAIIPGVYLQFRLSRLQIAHWNKNVNTRRTKSYIEWNLLQPDAISELRVNGLVRYLLNLRRKLRDKDEKAQLDFERSFISRRIGADVLQSVAELGSVVWVVVQIINRQQPVGQFVYVQQIVSRAMEGAKSFVGELSTIDEDIANLADYQQFMALGKGTGGSRTVPQTPQAITFDDVSFHYHGATSAVLQHVSFDINKGDRVAIVGENGAGKSTLIKLLIGLYEPSDGAILVDGVPLTDIDKASWHRQVSVLQQDFQKYQFADIKDNVYYGDIDRPFDKQRYMTATREAEAAEFIAKLPHKDRTLPSSWMEDDDGNDGTKISGGQWQRLALARNFYRDSPIIILDEPTSAIDALAESRIFKRLFDRANGRTIITVSHRLSTVEKADAIIVLSGGAIVESGTHRDLIARRGHYYELFENQLTQVSE